MNYFISTLIKLSENDKRVLIALCLLVLVIIVIVGYLTILVKKIMTNQGKKVDKMMYDIMKAKVITDSKTFSRVAKLKSRRYLVKQSWLPLLIALFFTGVILVYGWATGDYGMHYFVQGWYDISFTIEWEMTTVFGFLKLPADFGHIGKLSDFSWNFGKYLAVCSTIIGGVATIIYLLRVQAYIARGFRIRKLKDVYFGKDLTKLAEQQM